MKFGTYFTLSPLIGNVCLQPMEVMRRIVDEDWPICFPLYTSPAARVRVRENEYWLLYS